MVAQSVDENLFGAGSTNPGEALLVHRFLSGFRGAFMRSSQPARIQNTNARHDVWQAFV